MRLCQNCLKSFNLDVAETESVHIFLIIGFPTIYKILKTCQITFYRDVKYKECSSVANPNPINTVKRFNFLTILNLLNRWGSLDSIQGCDYRLKLFTRQSLHGLDKFLGICNSQLLVPL